MADGGNTRELMIRFRGDATDLKSAAGEAVQSVKDVGAAVTETGAAAESGYSQATEAQQAFAVAAGQAAREILADQQMLAAAETEAAAAIASATAAMELQAAQAAIDAQHALDVADAHQQLAGVEQVLVDATQASAQASGQQAVAMGAAATATTEAVTAVGQIAGEFQAAGVASLELTDQLDAVDAAMTRLEKARGIGLMRSAAQAAVELRTLEEAINDAEAAGAHFGEPMQLALEELRAKIQLGIAKASDYAEVLKKLQAETRTTAAAHAIFGSALDGVLPSLAKGVGSMQSLALGSIALGLATQGPIMAFHALKSVINGIHEAADAVGNDFVKQAEEEGKAADASQVYELAMKAVAKGQIQLGATIGETIARYKALADSSVESEFVTERFLAALPHHTKAAVTGFSELEEASRRMGLQIQKEALEGESAFNDFALNHHKQVEAIIKDDQLWGVEVPKAMQHVVDSYHVQEEAAKALAFTEKKTITDRLDANERLILSESKITLAQDKVVQSLDKLIGKSKEHIEQLHLAEAAQAAASAKAIAALRSEGLSEDEYFDRKRELMAKDALLAAETSMKEVDANEKMKDSIRDLITASGLSTDEYISATKAKLGDAEAAKKNAEEDGKLDKLVGALTGTMKDQVITTKGNADSMNLLKDAVGKLPDPIDKAKKASHDYGTEIEGVMKQTDEGKKLIQDYALEMSKLVTAYDEAGRATERNLNKLKAWNDEMQRGLDIVSLQLTGA